MMPTYTTLMGAPDAAISGEGVLGTLVAIVICGLAAVVFDAIS